MFCPVCESEYEPGITHCADDNTPLVERLTPEDTLHDSSEARFVTLHRLGSPAEAEMVNDILQQNGIRSVVKSGGHDAFSPLLSATAEGAEIFVDERDLDRALEIYDAFFGGDTTPLTGGLAEGEEEEERVVRMSAHDESDAIVVFMTAANGEEATRLADMLVGAHLAACVQILPEMESVYRWQGKIERQAEVLLLAKTTRAKFDELEREVRALHSYDTPEIIAVPITVGSSAYLDWLRQATDFHG